MDPAAVHRSQAQEGVHGGCAQRPVGARPSTPSIPSIPSAEFVSDPSTRPVYETQTVGAGTYFVHTVAMINGFASCFNWGRRRKDDRMFWAPHGSAVFPFWRWSKGR